MYYVVVVHADGSTGRFSLPDEEAAQDAFNSACEEEGVVYTHYARVMQYPIAVYCAYN